jgi:hypothetical protein
VRTIRNTSTERERKVRNLCNVKAGGTYSYHCGVKVNREEREEYIGFKKRQRYNCSLLNQWPRHEDLLLNGGIAPSFLTSALYGGEWSASCSGRFNSGKGPPVPVG